MSRILLADDSPHAQRMGERILREEGFEVVSVTDGETALKRLAEVDPDLIVADVFLPGKNGFELCRFVKSQPSHRHVKVIMTAGLLEVFDEDEARRAGADAIIKKPFEASAVIAAIKPLVVEAQVARGVSPHDRVAPAAAAQSAAAPLATPEPAAAPAIKRVPIAPKPHTTFVAAPKPAQVPPAPEPIDSELVRAAVTVALDAVMTSLVDEITERVVLALKGAN
jgi:CheY-like chemotaxis protein